MSACTLRFQLQDIRSLHIKTHIKCSAIKLIDFDAEKTKRYNQRKVELNRQPKYPACVVWV